MGKSFWFATTQVLDTYCSKTTATNLSDDLFMYFVAMSRNDRVTTDGYNGRVYLLVEATLNTSTFELCSSILTCKLYTHKIT